MKRVSIGTVLFALALPAPALADGPPGPKPTLAVYVDNASQYPAIARQLADAITQSLINSGKVSVIDRQHVAAITHEQDNSAAGQVTPVTQSTLGRMLGVQYLIETRVTAFGASAGGGGGPFRIRLPGIASSSLSDQIEIIDVNSGEVLQSIDDKQSASSPLLPGQSGQSDTTQSLVSQSANALAAKVSLEKLRPGNAPPAVTGKILDVSGDTITLSIGSESGVTVGQIFDYFQARSVTNPDTGQVIRTLIKRGSVQVTQVANGYSIAKSLPGGSPTKLETVMPEAP